MEIRIAPIVWRIHSPGSRLCDLDFRRLPIPPARRIAFKQDLLAKLRGLHGVNSAAEVEILPLSGGSTSNNVWIEGTDGSRKLTADFNWIGAGYLKTMGMPLLAAIGVFGFGAWIRRRRAAAAAA